ncbi:hypothetical protein D3C84_881720 [compost metagenome]
MQQRLQILRRGMQSLADRILVAVRLLHAVRQYFHRFGCDRYFIRQARKVLLQVPGTVAVQRPFAVRFIARYHPQIPIDRIQMSKQLLQIDDNRLNRGLRYG